MKRSTDFRTIGFEGGLLPDLLRRVLDPKAKLDGIANLCFISGKTNKIIVLEFQ